MNIDLIRSQFPALALQHDGQSRTYLDNPAGTQVPNQVLDAMRLAVNEMNGGGLPKGPGLPGLPGLGGGPKLPPGFPGGPGKKK